VPAGGNPNSPPTPTQLPTGAVQIAYRDAKIMPAKAKVKVGSTLVWTNYDSIEHNVTSESGPLQFASKNIEEGQSFQLTLTKPGLVRYVCTIHASTMRGTIEVIR
jgi:plastocyanin